MEDNFKFGILRICLKASEGVAGLPVERGPPLGAPEGGPSRGPPEIPENSTNAQQLCVLTKAV